MENLRTVVAQLYPKIASRAHMTPDEISKISWEKVAQKLPSVRLRLLALFTFKNYPGSAHRNGAWSGRSS